MENEINNQYDELRSQVEELTKRVHQLEQEVSSLKEAKISLQNQPVRPNVKVVSNSTSNVTKDTDALAPSSQKVIKDSIAGASVLNTTQKVSNAQSKKKSLENKNIESKIGKNLMAIVASVLILFSLILFGGLILPYITNGVRYAIMLFVSIAFGAVGIKFMRKDSRYYGLFSAMAAVGVSGFYITNIIGYYGFKLISEVVLMILILAWLVITITLAKIKSKMFLIISNIGLVVASILATTQWASIYIGVFVYILGLLALYLLNKSDDYNRDAYVFLQIPVMLGVFALFYSESWQVIAFVIIATIIYLLPQFLYEMSKKHIPVMIITLVQTSLFSFGACVYLWITEASYGVIFAIVMLIIAIVVRIKRSQDCKALVFISHYMMIASLWTLNLFVEYSLFVGFFGIALVLLAIGYLKKSDHFKYPGLAYLALAIMFPPEFFEGYPSIIFGGVIIAALFVLTYRMYREIDKYLITILTGLWLSGLFDYANVSSAVYFVGFGILCLYVNSKAFLLDFVSKEKEMIATIISYIFAGAMLIFAIGMLLDNDLQLGLGDIYSLSEGLSFVIVLLMTLSLCIINCRRILKSSLPQFLVGCYTCFKFMILMLLILHRFEIASFGLTLCTFLFAVICIAIGFAKKYKPFRIYGLVLTLLSVLKLAVFDIEYDSNLLRPIGFLIAGLLCFGISWGYTAIEKHQEK